MLASSSNASNIQLRITYDHDHHDHDDNYNDQDDLTPEFCPRFREGSTVARQHEFLEVHCAGIVIVKKPTKEKKKKIRKKIKIKKKN